MARQAVLHQTAQRRTGRGYMRLSEELFGKPTVTYLSLLGRYRTSGSFQNLLNRVLFKAAAIDDID